MFCMMRKTARRSTIPPRKPFHFMKDIIRQKYSTYSFKIKCQYCTCPKLGGVDRTIFWSFQLQFRQQVQSCGVAKNYLSNPIRYKSDNNWECIKFHYHLPDQKTMRTWCLGGFSVMWVAKLLLSPLKTRIFCLRTTKFGIFVHLWPGLAGSFGALLVGWVVWWFWRAGCISQDTYLLY